MRPRLALRLSRASDPSDGDVELGFRYAAVQVGYWLGWATIVAVLIGLAFDAGAGHRRLVVAATLAAAAANTVAMVIPWREWLTARRGRLLLDLWCAGLIAFVAVLVTGAGSTFALLLFLALPFIAVVQAGWRRGFWLAVSAVTCLGVAALVPLPVGATAIRLALVGVAVAAALVLSRAVRVHAARAELERALVQEASHRIKNDLQTAADFLLLARPDGAAGEAFDETAARIRSIAAVHRLLAETADRVDGGTLLRRIAAGAAVPVDVEAEPVVLDPETAQKLGIVANELLANAVRHGAPPIVVQLSGGTETRLRIEDRGTVDRRSTGSGLGLGLVRRMVEQGLHGRLELRAGSAGAGTSAEVVFPARSA